MEKYEKNSEEVIVEGLVSKINMEENLLQIRRYLSTLIEKTEGTDFDVIKRIDIQALRLKIEASKNFTEIAWVISVLDERYQKIAAEFINILKSKIDKEEDLAKSITNMSHVDNIETGVALKLVDSIVLKIDKEEDFKKIEESLVVISKMKKEVASAIFENMDIQILISKTKKEGKLWMFKKLISSLVIGNIEVAQKFLKGLPPKMAEQLGGLG